MMRFAFVLYVLCALCFCLLDWPAGAQGPPGGSELDLTERAYARVQQYQADSHFTATMRDGRWLEIDETDLKVAWDRPTRRLSIDAPGCRVVCDGQKLHATMARFPGVYLAVDQPDPLTYAALLKQVPALGQMPVPDAIFLLAEHPVFVLSEGASATASPLPPAPDDMRARPRLQTAAAHGTLTLFVNPAHRLLGAATLTPPPVPVVGAAAPGPLPGAVAPGLLPSSVAPGQTSGGGGGGEGGVRYDITITRLDQPIDDAAFAFDTTGLTPVTAWNGAPAPGSTPGSTPGSAPGSGGGGSAAQGKTSGGGGGAFGGASGGGHPLIGEPAPGFQLPDAAGVLHRLKDFDEDVLLIGFWASWAPPCAQVLPAWQAIADAATEAGRSVRVITINVGETPEVVAEGWKKMDLSVVGLFDEAFAVGDGYGMTVIPHTVLVQNGKIRYLHSGPSDDYVTLFQTQIDRLLSSPTPTPPPEVVPRATDVGRESPPEVVPRATDVGRESPPEVVPHATDVGRGPPPAVVPPADSPTPPESAPASSK